MRPRNIGLLVIGAALAGGLAFRMTQAPVIPAAAPAARQGSPAGSQVTGPVPAAKAAPIPVAPAAVTAPQTATAPPPIYNEPVKPAIRKNKPNFVAQAKPAPSAKPSPWAKPTPWVEPTDWSPGRYVPPVDPPAQPVAALPVPMPAVPTPAVPAPSLPVPAVPAPVEQATLHARSAPTARRVMLRTGMTIAIRVDESLSSERSVAGDTFQASLAEPLVVDGLVIAERGARVTGRIVDARKAGRVSGSPYLELELGTLATSDGQRIAISTDPWTKQGDSTQRDSAEKIGGGAALGAIIGAIAGGGMGAAIGAGVGGGAGAGAAMITHGRSVNVPSETLIRFRLASKVIVTEQELAGR